MSIFFIYLKDINKKWIVQFLMMEKAHMIPICRDIFNIEFGYNEVSLTARKEHKERWTQQL